MKISILIGSIRDDRQSHRLAFYLEKVLTEKGTSVDVIDLSQTPLPLFGNKENENNNIQIIGKRLKNSDAILFVTPEYHGSFSGVLKNALEFYGAEFYKKPIGVATASAGKMSGINASVQLQHVILSMGAFPLPVKLLIPEIKDAFDDTYTPLRENISVSAEKFIKEFLWFAEAIAQKKNIALAVS